MKKENALHILEDALNEALENDEYGFEYDEDGVYIGVSAGDGFFSLMINCKGDCKGSCEKDGKCSEEEATCDKMRKEFSDRLGTMDEEILDATLRSFDSGALLALNDAIFKCDCPETVKDGIHQFTEACNTTIQKRVEALKAQMI